MSTKVPKTFFVDGSPGIKPAKDLTGLVNQIEAVGWTALA
jgi:hypothetical protein